MTAPFAAAILAALCFGTASVLQHMAAGRAEQGALLDLRVLLRLGRQGPYMAGLGLDALGFGLSAWALRLLPLFVVEAVLASSLAVTAVVAAAVAREALRPAERNAVVGIVAGLVLLAVSAAPERAGTGRSITMVLAAGVPLLVLAAAFLGRRRAGNRPGIALAALGGLAFAGFGMAAHVLGAPPRPPLLVDPVAWTLAAYVGLGLLFYGSALQRGKVTTVTAACVVVETLVPSMVGVVALGDGVRSGLGTLAAAGFVMTIAAVVSLARTGARTGTRPVPSPAVKVS